MFARRGSPFFHQCAERFDFEISQFLLTQNYTCSDNRLSHRYTYTHTHTLASGHWHAAGYALADNNNRLDAQLVSMRLKCHL